MNNERKTHVGWSLAALMVTMLLTSLDQTIVSTAMPTVIERLGGMDLYPWVFTVYMLTSTAAMPIVGKLSDIYGRKRFFLGGLVIFMLGSALCGAAQNMIQLILFRGIQGVGAGSLMPITFTLIFTMVPQEKAAKLQSMFMAVFGLSSVVGPTAGSFITEHFSWRWNFYINIPLGIAATLILVFALVESARLRQTRKIDYLGAILLVVSTVSMMLGLKEAGTDFAWGSWQVLSLLGGAIVVGLLFLWVETRAVEPMLPLNLFKNRVISGVSFATFVQGIVMFGALTYIPLFIQGVIGGNVGDAGNLLTPMMFTVMIGATVGSITMRKLSWRGNMVASMLIAAVGCYFMAVVPATAHKWDLVLYMILIGLGIGVMMPIAQTAILVTADEKYQGIASSTVGFFRAIGAVFGTSIMATVVNQHMQNVIANKLAALHVPASQTAAMSNPQVLLNAGNLIPANVLATLRQVLAESIHYGFWFVLGAAVVSILTSLLIGGAKFQPAEWAERQARQQARPVSAEAVTPETV